MEAIGDNYFAYRRHHRRRNVVYERQKWQMTNPRLEPWVDRITGLVNGELCRERLQPIKDYTHSTGTGARGVYFWYFLAPGIYEINERTSWQNARRYFVRSHDGALDEIGRDEAIEWLTSDISASPS